MQDLNETEYDGLEPFQWPAPVSGVKPAKGELAPTRFFAEGNFFTPDRKARFVAVASSAPVRTSQEFPLVLNTGRIRDQWHTMTRTAKSARLSQHIAEPFAEFHPDDAKELGIRDADIVEITSTSGAILVRALLSARQRKGSVFVPMHWTDQLASSARVDRLVQPTTDPVSGQPASKHIAVAAKPIFASAYGFAVLAQRPTTIEADYWALARCPEGWRVELAFTGEGHDWTAFAAQLFETAEPAETLSYQDASTGQQRSASFVGSRLAGALFIGPSPVAVSRNWAVEQLATNHSGRHHRLAVLAARPGTNAIDRGSTVCSCFGVGSKQIANAARAGCRTVEAIGQTLQAGTNCGSCRAEIRSIIEANLLEAAE